MKRIWYSFYGSSNFSLSLKLLFFFIQNICPMMILSPISYLIYWGRGDVQSSSSDLCVAKIAGFGVTTHLAES